jgi:elongation factor Ts
MAAEITPQMIKDLRERTGAGMADCKKALTECAADMEKSIEYLRKKGIASAAKKATRIASEGTIASYLHGARIGVMVEVNCETDFVARNPQFKELAHEIAMQIAAMNPSRIGDEPTDGDEAAPEGDAPLLDQAYIRDNSKTIRDLVKQGMSGFGENIVVRRFMRFELGGE